MKKSRKITTIVAIIILLTGICCVLYGPFINFSYNETNKHAIQDYNDTFYIDNNPDNNNENNKKSNHNNVSLEELRRDVLAYNKSLVKNGQSKLQSKEYYVQSPLNLSDYGIKNNIYGYLQIEKLHLNMPIYLGASDYNMSLGAAQMNYSSIPYGEKNSNVVLAGHCGYGYCDYFRYLDSLSVGDEIIVLTPFKKLKYKVSQKCIIDPCDISRLVIKKNKDIVTLVTCHPYPTSNYRLIVNCERVK